MNLPLFKGLSHEQVSAFLEKTHITFSKYSDNEKIVSAEDRADVVKCVISGKIRVAHRIGKDNTLKITELQHNNNVLGADRLFGMDTTCGFEAYAVGNVSTMEFSKEQYMGLLSSGSIYLLNYLNFLSYRAQIRYSIFETYPEGGLKAICSRLIKAYCSKNSQEISLSFDMNSFAKFCNMDTETLYREMICLENTGIIRRTPLDSLSYLFQKSSIEKRNEACSENCRMKTADSVQSRFHILFLTFAIYWLSLCVK